jgi:hypothetical protein
MGGGMRKFLRKVQNAEAKPHYLVRDYSCFIKMFTAKLPFVSPNKGGTM